MSLPSCTMKAFLAFYFFLAAVTAQYDYNEVLFKSLLFYQAQRSGKLSNMNPLVSWRKDAALHDTGENGEDLTGGYFDAGDFVKFGFPGAFTITILAWGAINHMQGYANAGQEDEILRAIRWGTDYLIKCHVSPNEFYGQVGNSTLDHNYWGRPEDMTMERPAYKIDADNPGSDLAAESAAAMAAASVVFRPVDASYADILVSHAKELFNFANSSRQIYSKSITDAAENYGSSGFEDELVWGAAWLHYATRDNDYLEYAEKLYEEFSLQNYSGLSWDSKHSGADILLAKFTGRSKYMEKLVGYCDWLRNSAPRTPKGLVFLAKWGTLGSAAYASLICMEVGELRRNRSLFQEFAESQIHYMLGSTGRSFVVGFGNNPPTHTHHSSSSCPDAPAPCDWNTYHGPQPNEHTLFGALVGGPSGSDAYDDSRQDYVGNEVACDYNAGFQTLLAALNKFTSSQLD